MKSLRTPTLTTMALAFLASCATDSTPPPGIGSVEMEVTLATPPAGPNEQIDAVDVSLWCDGVDPVLGVPRPPQANPEQFTVNTATSQGPEPYNTIGLLEKQGLPQGNCYFEFYAISNSGNTECTGELTVAITTDQTTQSEVVLACIHQPRYGGVRTDGTFNQCAEYRQILVTPTTQAIGNLIDVATEVYDPDGDDVTVSVQGVGACGNVEFADDDAGTSCESVSGCDAVISTVECTDVGLCQIIVAVSDDGFDSCAGILPNGENNNAARSTINVDCTVAQGCGNGQIEPGEECDPPDGVFCDENCQLIDPCESDPCATGDVCNPGVCTADPVDNTPVCSTDPGSAVGTMCSPPEGGTCDGLGNCVSCTQDSECDDNEACTDNACVAGECVFTPNDNNQCSIDGFPGSCNGGVCEGLCTGVTCPDPGECVSGVCDPATGDCSSQNDGINTGCDLGGNPGVCDGAGACVQCNEDAQCGAGETCVNNACEASSIACEYEQDFELLTPGDPPQGQPTDLAADGWLVGANVFESDGTFAYNYFAFPAPNGGAAFSAVAEGEGGPDQGARQLSIYSDYDNADHAVGRIIEAIVFQERDIVPGDVGTTVTFTFDAKRGNIEGATTALAFIKTLDPGAEFATTNFISEDTTDLPATWGAFSISLAIDASLVGQVLQIGFQNRASNFEGSGVFYDNVKVGPAGCSGEGGVGIELRPLPEIYATGKAINYGPFRGTGPGTGDIPSDSNILEDLTLMDLAGFDLIRLFGADAISERILSIAQENFPQMQFQQGLFLEGLAPGPAQENCQSTINDSQIATAIQLANTYSNVATVSVGNETSFFAAFMPLDCLEGYIIETRSNISQPVTADDDYTFYAGLFGRLPDSILRQIDFVAIHMYPFTNYQQWDWQQLGVPAGPLRAEAMMNAAFAKAQDNFSRVSDYPYRSSSGQVVSIGESLPIVIGETGWKWRQTNNAQEIELYTANPVNAKWYSDLMRSWERTPGGPETMMLFVSFDEQWKGTDDGWGFWDQSRNPLYALCDTPAGAPCNNPVYDGAGFYPF